MEIIKKENFIEGNTILEQYKNIPYEDKSTFKDLSY